MSCDWFGRRTDQLWSIAYRLLFSCYICWLMLICTAVIEQPAAQQTQATRWQPRRLGTFIWSDRLDGKAYSGVRLEALPQRWQKQESCSLSVLGMNYTLASYMASLPDHRMMQLLYLLYQMCYCGVSWARIPFVNPHYIAVQQIYARHRLSQWWHTVSDKSIYSSLYSLWTFGLN